MKKNVLILNALLVLTPALLQAQDYTYETNNGAITITGYTGTGGDVTIPDTIDGLAVARIVDGAFHNCSSLTNITIPAGVIGALAFSQCTGLTNAMIGNGVTNIGERAFAFCSNLTTLSVDPSNGFYRSVDGVLFNKNQTELIRYPPGKMGNYTIPNTVTSIGDWAFLCCANLTNVTIGSRVTVVGNYAFMWCQRLTAFLVDADNTVYGSVNGVLFKKNSATLIKYPMGRIGSYTIPNDIRVIGQRAFLDCAKLTTVIIPDGVNDVGELAFHSCAGLNSVTIGNSVTNIGLGAFAWCESLTNVVIPDGVTRIESGVFNDCDHLTNVTIASSVASIDNYAFRNCPSLAAVYFKGNAPRLGGFVFDDDDKATIYYRPGTTGWGSTFGGRPTALWNQKGQSNVTVGEESK